VLIGSSLGAFVAWHVAARADVRADAMRPVSHLVLLAPALDFGANRMKDLGEAGLRDWRDTNWKEFFHHAFNEPRRVHYALYEDARQYVSGAAQVPTPGIVFQGTRDQSVDPAMVSAFVAERPTLTLHLLDDDHQLLSSLDTIWDRTAAFLGLKRAG
jgi:pimeloyl-ACP methyl ester carboxylesterase